MVDNDPPTEEEVDRMVELYEDDRTVREVAEHGDIDYSRTTVNKWINRRQLETEGQDETPDPEPTPADADGSGGTMVEEVEESVPVEEKFSDILEDEPPTPNEILWDVLESDPDLGDKHIEYLRQFEDQYGVFAPDDVTGKLSELKISNKRMTINRAVSNYRTEINRKLQKDEGLAKREEWALLLTKTTGDPRYLREAEGGSNPGQFEQAGPTIQGPGEAQHHARSDQIQPPVPGGAPQQNGSAQGRGGEQGGNGQYQPIQPQNQTARGSVPRQDQPARDPARGQPVGASPQQQGQQQGLNEFQQKILEMLEQQIEGQSQTPDMAPSQQDSLTSQIQEIAEIQETLEGMGGSNGGNEELAEAVQQINQKVDTKLAQLEARIAEEGANGGGSQPAPMPTGGEGGTLTQIAALAQQIEDPDVLSTVIESQMDPEVIKAKAETEEVENDAQFKRALAEALSPAATEKAIEAVSNLTSGISTAAQQAQQQPRQAQQPQQPAQQQRGVEVVEDTGTTAEEPAMSDPDESAEESSPLREQGEKELAGTDTTDEDDEEVEE
jgi:hypothetical protein